MLVVLLGPLSSVSVIVAVKEVDGKEGDEDTPSLIALIKEKGPPSSISAIEENFPPLPSLSSFSLLNRLNYQLVD